jgi:hypothetical protein
MRLSFFSNLDFSAKGVVKGVFVCRVAPETTPKTEKSRLDKKKTTLRSRFKHRDTIPGKFP